jgi:hypothetical protein
MADGLSTPSPTTEILEARTEEATVMNAHHTSRTALMVREGERG